MYVKSYRTEAKPVRRTKAEAEQTREAILAAAIETFLERGVTRATLDEIARAARVTRGAVYWHFRDKLEIFLALERRANLPNEEFGARLKARLAADPRLNPLDELANTIREGVQSFEADAERCRILTILWTRCEYVEEMLPVLRRQERADAALREMFEAVIGLAAERGQVAPCWAPELAARALLLLINGSVADWLRAQGKARLVTQAMPLVTAFLATVGLSPASAAAMAANSGFSGGLAVAKSRAGTSPGKVSGSARHPARRLSG
jgi:AcrR family transcriptional regulator